MKDTDHRPKVVVIGAGLAGLSAAWNLAKNGFDVTVLEKTAEIGGLAQTKKRAGFEYDLGPHNIFSAHRNIIRFYKRTFKNLFAHFPKSIVIKNKKAVDYPLRGLKVLSVLPLHKTIPVAMNFLLARALMYLNPFPNEENYKDWIVNRFGYLLYREYFRNYSEKVWALPAEKIDKYVALKRIPTISLLELVRSLFSPALRRSREAYDVDCYYLPHGIGEIPAFFTRELAAMSVPIVKQASVESVTHEESDATHVSYQAESGDTTKIECDYLLNTAPLPDFLGYFSGSSEKVRSASAQLSYCATILLFVIVDRVDALPAYHVYFNDKEVKFARSSELGRYSREMMPEGKTLLCFEFPCSVGDKVWGSAAEVLTQHVIDSFQEDGIIKADQVSGSFVEKLSHAYPRFEVGFMENLGVCFEFLSGFRNVISYGRQGGFLYVNTDEVVHQGFAAAEAIRACDTVKLACWEHFEQSVKCSYNEIKV